MPRFLLVAAVVLLIRLPFLNQAVQGDDYYYLAAAQHAQVDPVHPHHARYVFMGVEMDMRGHPHPPGDAWILAGLLAIFGDVREVPFHAAYLLFSLAAAWGMWRLAQQYIPERALEATLLFVAVPAFIVSGNSFESDLPFLAFWMLAAAAGPVTTQVPALAAAAICAYQSMALVPILWLRKRSWAVVTPLVVFAAYQLFERFSGSELPAQVLAGHFQTHGFQSFDMKWRNAVALTGHMTMMFSPVGFVALIVAIRRRIQPWLLVWLGLFFAASLLLFFAGSARYLLPLAAPYAIVVATVWRDRPKLIWACLAFQLALGLGLAWVNYEHWGAYREFVREIYRTHASERVWVDSEWGLRFYAEAEGALPVVKGQELRPGDWLITSELSGRTPVTLGGGALVRVRERQVMSALPLRLMGEGTGSGYSSVIFGLFPFGWSSQPLDVVRLHRIVERQPDLSWLPMNAASAENQIVSGVNNLEEGQWRWMAGTGAFLLKSPPQPQKVRVEIYVPDASPARRFIVKLDGQEIAAQTLPGPGKHVIETAPQQPKGATATLSIEADHEFSPPNDGRKLSAILTAVGFHE